MKTKLYKYHVTVCDTTGPIHDEEVVAWEQQSAIFQVAAQFQSKDDGLSHNPFADINFPLTFEVREIQ